MYNFLSAADEVYKISSSNTLNSLVLSKGHACLALYSLMAHSGIVPLKKILNSLKMIIRNSWDIHAEIPV